MATGGADPHLHPVATRNHRYQYLFHPKHHDYGRRDVAQWRRDMTREEEFAVFDLADTHDLLDGDGHLYGLHLDPDGGLRELGTFDQQVAMFPRADEGRPWHGYPLAPLRPSKPPRPPDRRIPVGVLLGMERAGLLRPEQRARLAKGKPAR